MKTEIFNLIILDESGSMGCVRKQTISGCNETLNTIRAAQKTFAETQEHFVSIYAFQSGATPSRYIVKNVPATAVDSISERDYEPCGCTPLYDAIGSTLTDLRVTMKKRELAIGNVTIITDGMENSSERYSLDQVSRMISDLKEKGWSFNFIGANIDVDKTAHILNIDNALEFCQDEEGTKRMFEKERQCRLAWNERADRAMKRAASSVNDGKSREETLSDLVDDLKTAATNYFDCKRED